MVDMGAYESPGTNQIRFDADGTTLTWSAVAGAQSYNVYLGDVFDLTDSDLDGQPDSSYGACANDLDTDTSDTLFVANGVPAPGVGFFYLVTFVDTLGVEWDLGFTHSCTLRMLASSCS